MLLVDCEKGVELDDIDMNIIKKLSSNSRKSLVDIAYELKTTVRIVNYRIKQLVQNRIVTGFRIAIDYSKLGIQFYKLLIYLENPTEQEIKNLIHYFKNNKNLIHHVRVLGSCGF